MSSILQKQNVINTAKPNTQTVGKVRNRLLVTLSY